MSVDLPHWARVIDARIVSACVPGIVGLVDRGRQTIIHASGFRDLATAAAMRASTLFRIASVSKPLTTAGAMLLVDEGRIALDEPVDRWLPELANRGVLRTIASGLDDTVPAQAPVSLRALLIMNFGLGFDYSYRPRVIEAMRTLEIAPFGFPAGCDAYLRRLGTLPLIAQPGARWLYHVRIDVRLAGVSRVLGESRLGAGAVRRHRREPGLAHAGPVPLMGRHGYGAIHGPYRERRNGHALAAYDQRHLGFGEGRRADPCGSRGAGARLRS